MADWRASLLALACALVTACGPQPPWYELVSLEEATTLLVDPDVALIDAHEPSGGATQPLPRGLRWEIGPGTPEVPDQLHAEQVLIVASSENLAHRAAAAVARAGGRAVYVCVLESAEERGSLYAEAVTPEEVMRGRDS